MKCKSYREKLRSLETIDSMKSHTVNVLKTNVGAADKAKKCPEEDSNLHGVLTPPGPQPGASANSAIWAGISRRRTLSWSDVGINLMRQFLQNLTQLILK